MEQISTIRQVTYMPHRVFRLLSAMHDVASTCLANYVYFKAIQQVEHSNCNDWYMATHNAYYDSCVLHWCMLFGDHNSEKTHYFHLINPIYDLEENLKTLGLKKLNIAHLTELITGENKIEKKTFRKFTKNTLFYRNKNLIHREHDPDEIYDGLIVRPLTKTIFTSAYKLNEMIIKIASAFPSIQNTRNKYALSCLIFANIEELQKGYLQTFPLKKRTT